MSPVVVPIRARDSARWRLGTRLWTIVGLLLLGTGAIPTPSTVEAQPPPLIWSALGPGDHRMIAQIAVSPDWPADPFLYVVRYETSEGYGRVSGLDAARSYDGGHIWERIPR
jgi:hypothetical protein